MLAQPVQRESLILGLLLVPIIVQLGSMSFSNRSRYSRRLHVTLGQRYLEDQVLLQSDKSHWYNVSTDMINQDLSRLFVQLDADEETLRFIEQSIEKSDWFFTQMWHNLAKSFLSFFYATTDINGLLGRGSMFVISRQQLKNLLAPVMVLDENSPLPEMIDLGAGDGAITEIYKTFFNKLFATEASKVMRKSLEQKDVKVLPIDSWFQQADRFDLISCLNLLDRCDKPHTVLHQIKSSLKPDGIAVIALVIPYSPYVEFPQPSNEKRETPNSPLENLNIKGGTFEVQAESLAQLFSDIGFNVVSWSRVPYMCEGDLAKSVYTLNDVIFVLKKKSQIN